MLTCSCVSTRGDSFQSRRSSHETTSPLNTPAISDKTSPGNIIITPEEFYAAAQALATFHNMEGTPTTIVNITWIEQTYTPAPFPSYLGYANRIIPRLFVHRYNYPLARKIISFLQENSYYTNGTYLTLFGNGNHVPPSYYFYSQGRVMTRLGIIPLPSFYNNIVASDFFYTSPNYDFIPEYKVGRLPVATEEEAWSVVQKIISWKQDVSWEWFKNVYVAGDQPNLLEEINLNGSYVGEMIACDAINKEYFSDMDVTKLFWTDGLFNKADILNVLEEGNAGFFYMMAHGYVDRWGTYKETDPYIYADDLLALSAKNNVPIIVSVACMSGAYETDLAMPYALKHGTRSLGEAVVLSEGAGIAYIGTTRATLGSPLIYLDHGEVVITKERGIAGMLTFLFEAYRNGIDTLGNLMDQAILSYLADNTFPTPPEKDNSFVVLMSFVLLGDPALEIPHYTQTNPDKFLLPHITPNDPEGYTNEEYSRPWYYINTNISLSIITDSPEITIKRIDIPSETVVERVVLTMPLNNTFTYSFTSETPTQYLIRAEALDAKETWFYLTTVDQ